MVALTTDPRRCAPSRAVSGGRHVTATVLEAHGLVERLPHPGDRRRKLVTLTAAGHAAIATANEIMLRTPRPSGRSRPPNSGN
ncbi:hypothetical protein ABIA39_000785 [Nocardia sp. GAS34]|uniref:hypothetical protein n=1 Tax=unclassified Nocardia TaxID=2637762 RepID=UPI003D1FFC5C